MLELRKVLMLVAVLFLLQTARGATQEALPKEGVLRATLENGFKVVIVRNTLSAVV